MKQIITFLVGTIVAGTSAAQEIRLRHELDGKALDVLATQVLRFNDEQKGKGKVVLQDARGLENKQQLPELALLNPDDGMEFFGTRPRFHPLHEVMREAGQKFDAAQFFPQIADAADDVSGRLQALPLGLSLPALFVNRVVLRKAGIDPDARINTWWDLQKVAGEVFDRGTKCPLTTSRFAWIHAENVTSQAGEPMARKAGSAEGLGANGMVNVKHLALLASWQKSHYFHYDGPGREGERRFLSGECAMITGESSLYAQARRSGIDVGVMALPHYDDVYAAKPADVLPDGAALWVLAGQTKDELRLIGRLVAFLMRPEVQKEWVAATSYLPMTPAALAALRESDIPPALLDAAQKRLSAPRKDSTRLKHGPLRDRLREFIGEEVAFVWSKGRAAKEALDTAVQRVQAAIAPAAAATPSTPTKPATPRR